MDFYWEAENKSNKKIITYLKSSLVEKKIKYENCKGMVSIRKNCNFKQDGQGNSHYKVDI